MVVNSPHSTLSFVIFSCVCFSFHFDEDVNEIIDGSHAGFRVSVENISIVDEHKYRTCHFDNNFKGGFDDKHMGLIVLI